MLFPVGKSASKKKNFARGLHVMQGCIKRYSDVRFKGIVGKGRVQSIMSGSYRAKLPGVISQSNSLDALYAVQTFDLL